MQDITQNTALHQNLLKKFITTFLPESRNSLNRQKFELSKISAIIISIFKERFNCEVTVCEIHKALESQNFSAYTIQSSFVVRTDSPYTAVSAGYIYYYINPDRMCELRYLLTKNTDKLPLHVLSNIYELDKQIDLFKKLQDTKMLSY